MLKKKIVLAVLFTGISAWSQSVDQAIVSDLDFYMKLDLVRTQEMLTAGQDNLAKQNLKNQVPKPDLKEGQSEKN